MTSLPDRFWSKVDKSGDCWLWTACASPSRPGSPSYGKFSWQGRTRRAHILSYEDELGPTPEGKMLDHRCHNTLCVKPSHLRPVTGKQNGENRRGAARNNKSCGLRGVTFNDGRWVALVIHNGERIYIGRFLTAEEAGSAAAAKRNELFTHNDKDRVSEGFSA